MRVLDRWWEWRLRPDLGPMTGDGLRDKLKKRGFVQKPSGAAATETMDRG